MAAARGSRADGGLQITMLKVGFELGVTSEVYLQCKRQGKEKHGVKNLKPNTLCDSSSLEFLQSFYQQCHLKNVHDKHFIPFVIASTMFIDSIQVVVT